jgi:S-adenosylmethionine synthetase
VQVSYAIGIAEPTSVDVETFGTGNIEEDRISALVSEHFDLKPRGIIEMLDLLHPMYTRTAAYGHFGREDEGFPWERIDRASALRDAAGL